jgi:uncharacterized protein YeaO (DUF488 family)
MIRTKRVYSRPSAGDGTRILVDRVWPRGVSKERAHIGAWRKELAPSTQLRKWFGHDPAKWIEFRKRYRKELAQAARIDALNELTALARRKTVTLVYGAADEEHNQAVALKEMLDDLQTERRCAEVDTGIIHGRTYGVRTASRDSRTPTSRQAR